MDGNATFSGTRSSRSCGACALSGQCWVDSLPGRDSSWWPFESGRPRQHCRRWRTISLRTVTPRALSFSPFCMLRLCVPFFLYKTSPNSRAPEHKGAGSGTDWFWLLHPVLFLLMLCRRDFLLLFEKQENLSSTNFDVVPRIFQLLRASSDLRITLAFQIILLRVWSFYPSMLNIIVVVLKRLILIGDWPLYPIDGPPKHVRCSDVSRALGKLTKSKNFSYTARNCGK